MGLFLGLLRLQAQSSCTDLNGYVDLKNSGNTGYYTLSNGYEENAAQTYHYSGPGSVAGVRVYGNFSGSIGGVPLKIGVYNVDASGRPTTLLRSVNTTWWWFDNTAGYINVNFGGGGVYVNNSFAVSVEMRNGFPWGDAFQLKYTGDGEGKGEDHPSLSGTSTGFNWTSAKNSFSKDGDFYIVPRVSNFITAEFLVNSSCVSTSSNVVFENTTQMSTDSMFNKIGLSDYSGSNYLYSWDFGDGSAISHEKNPKHSYANPGKYTVTLTSFIDGWNTDCSDVYSKDISVGLTVAVSSLINVSCNGGENGSITAAGSGGATPYMYSLNDIYYQSSPLFGNLTAGSYILFVRDNLGCNSTYGFTITEPSAITANISTTNSSCGGADGSILVTASGGVGTLNYQLNSGSFQTSNSFTKLVAGPYHITVKDANNCAVSKLVLINDLGGPGFISISHTNVSCFGGNNGSITLNATGGSGTLQYSINEGTSFQTSGTFTGLTAGTYAVMVKDSKACNDIEDVTIEEPSDLLVNASSVPVSCYGGNNGEINITSAIGGTGTLSFSIDGSNFQSGTKFTGVSAGNYTVTVKDIAGCLGTTEVVVSQPSIIIANITTTPVTCYGSYNGSLVINATGGMAGYMYSIDGINFQSTGTFPELGVGTYTIIVKDENHCTYSNTATITGPSEITAAITPTNSTCGNNNGGLLIVASGGSENNFQYSIDGDNYYNTGSFSSLSAGPYYVIIKDGAGCEKIFSTSINDANGPSITSVSHTNISCHGGNDGTITINSVNGGTGTLNYSINGNNWQTSNLFTDNLAGTYTVLVKDNAGCIGNTSVTLTEPNAFVITTNIENVTCNEANNGSVTVNAGGGIGTLAYSINNGISFQSSKVFTGLHAGNYSVIVRDAAGCYGSTQLYISQPSEIVIYTGVLNVTCHESQNGSILVLSSGGTGEHMFSLDGENYQSSNSFTGLSGGSYTVYVRDSKNCIKTRIVNILEPAVINVSANISNVTCAGGNNGVIDLTIEGGTRPYFVSWSNGGSTEDKFNLTAGTYSVNIEDMNGCVYTNTYTVTQPINPIIVNGTKRDASNINAFDGAIDITVTGGSGYYTYSWSNGSTTEDISGLSPGLYTVIITDENKCQTSTGFVIGVKAGVKEITSGGHVMIIYPNPANESAVVESNGNEIQVLRIVDLLGKVMIQSEPKSIKVNVDTHNLNQGIYFVQIVVNDKLITKRLEIVR